MQLPESNGGVESTHEEHSTQYLEAAEATTADVESAAIAGTSTRDKAAILRERARRLAIPPRAQDANDDRLEVVEFMLSGEKYALEVSHVREVYPLKDLAPVPCTPTFVLGIISVRGQVISVVDTREFFNLPKNEITDESKVIVIKDRRMEFGILSDRVVGERKIPLNEIQSDVHGLRGNREEYVRGVTSEPVIVLDVKKILADERIIVHQEVGD
jgi:purine-binding chemotaxis protein CheW